MSHSIGRDTSTSVVAFNGEKRPDLSFHGSLPAIGFRPAISVPLVAIGSVPPIWQRQ
jgi:hypothetical protein